MPGYGWTNSTLQQMIANVDKLLLCTYDYKVREDNLQPLAPFEWFKDNVDFVYRLAQNKSEKRKLMMVTQVPRTLAPCNRMLAPCNRTLAPCKCTLAPSNYRLAPCKCTLAV